MPPWWFWYVFWIGLGSLIFLNAVVRGDGGNRRVRSRRHRRDDDDDSAELFGRWLADRIWPVKSVGARRAGTAGEVFPYALKPQLLSPDERELYKGLVTVVGAWGVVFVQVRVCDVVKVRRGYDEDKYSDLCARMHLDLLVCEKNTLAPRFAVELDGLSHSDQKQSKYDERKNRILEAAGLPLIRLPSRKYTVDEVNRVVCGVIAKQ